VIAGDGAVGKTTIAQRLAGTLQLDEERHMTCGLEFHDLKISDNGNLKALIWDLGGQEQFHFFHNTFFNDALVIILVFSVEWYHSFLNLENWISMIPQDKEIEIFLVANKIDSTDRAISSEDAYEFAMKMNMNYHEISAISGEGFEVFANELNRKIKRETT
jgi:small GTP-binding protein